MSKTSQKYAGYSIHYLLKDARLSYQTKSNYKDILNCCIRTLEKNGFILRNIDQLKQKHIRSLVESWKNENLNIATIKNRMSVLRNACRLMNKTNVVFSNSHYDIGQRSYIPKENKAINAIDLAKIEDKYIIQSLKLQQAFGLRREESLKFNASIADKGDHIELQPSWTKGGISRVIPILTDEQRRCINEVKQLCGNNSLIPKEKTFIEQRNLYDRLTQYAGFSNLHGLRHAYAQKRYYSITGIKSPACGGPKHSSLSREEKKIDYKAREIISRELGHSRVAITKIYL